jgi:hypothetical protein
MDGNLVGDCEVSLAASTVANSWTPILPVVAFAVGEFGLLPVAFLMVGLVG